jgi:hypothetical protein
MSVPNTQLTDQLAPAKLVTAESDAEAQFVVAEYNALRDEISNRIQMQTQLSNIALTLSAAVTAAVVTALTANHQTVIATYIVLGLLILSAMFAALQFTSVEHEYEMIVLGQYIERRLRNRATQLVRVNQGVDITDEPGLLGVGNPPVVPVVWDWEEFRRTGPDKRGKHWPKWVPNVIWWPVRAGRYELQLGPAIFSLFFAWVVWFAYVRDASTWARDICLGLVVLDAVLIMIGIIYPWYIHSTYQPDKQFK